MDTALHRICQKLVRTGSLEIRYPDGKTRSYGDGGGPRAAISVLTPRALRAIGRDPKLALGECYMRGELVVTNGDIYDFLALVMRNETLFTLNTAWQNVLSWLRFASRSVAQFNGRFLSRRHIAHHYDADLAFYDLFLDGNRQYSCALFEPGDDLAAAQRRKMHHIGKKLILKPGMRVLDVGCGWGGLALGLARTERVRTTGITLSRQQFEAACQLAWRRQMADRVEFALRDYRDVEDRYDRVVSVGMLEHVGLTNYETYFKTIRRCLKKDGVALVHTIGRSDGPGFTNPFISKYIFPGGYFPALSELLPAIEKSGLFLTDVEVLRLHYAKTLEAWRKRLRQNWDDAVLLKGEDFCRMWEFYLAGSEAAFREQGLVVFQIQLAAAIDVVPLTRNYITGPDKPSAPAVPPPPSLSREAGRARRESPPKGT